MNKKCTSPVFIFSRNCKNSVLGCVLNLSPIVPDWVLSLSERLLLCSFEQLQSEAFWTSFILKAKFLRYKCISILPALECEAKASSYYCLLNMSRVDTGESSLTYDEPVCVWDGQQLSMVRDMCH